jgi:hypothetical protein
MKTIISSKYTAMQKIICCIDSCNKVQQFNVIDNFIEGFRNVYGDQEAVLYLIGKSYDKLLEIGGEL